MWHNREPRSSERTRCELAGSDSKWDLNEHVLTADCRRYEPSDRLTQKESWVNSRLAESSLYYAAPVKTEYVSEEELEPEETEDEEENSEGESREDDDESGAEGQGDDSEDDQEVAGVEENQGNLSDLNIVSSSGEGDDGEDDQELAGIERISATR